MILSGKTVGVRIRIWGNVTALIFGLLFVTNGNRTSAERAGAALDKSSYPGVVIQERNNDNVADQEPQFLLSYHSASSFSSDIQVSTAQHRTLFPQSNGLSLVNGFRNSPSELDNPPCQTRAQHLRKLLFFRGLIKCSRGETAEEFKMKGRVLATYGDLRHNEVPQLEKKTYNSVRKDDAIFHIDYSSPKTHPPKNN